MFISDFAIRRPIITSVTMITLAALDQCAHGAPTSCSPGADAHRDD